MLIQRHFRLRSLGQITLVSVAGDIETQISARPRHLAVLAVLALSPRAVARDTLVEMFWGGETETRARHSLSNALSGLRSLLGPDAISARSDFISLSPEARLEIDALQFAAACEMRDDETAAALYGGPLLEGLYVSDSPQFDLWVTRERGRLERQFLELCERHAPSLLRAGRWSEATALCERWVGASPRSTAAFTALITAHAGPDTPAALTSALNAYERTRTSLLEHHGVRVGAPINELAASIRERLSRSDAALSDSVAADHAVRPSIQSPSSDDGSALVRPRSPVRRHPARVWFAVGGAVIAIGLIALWSARRPPVVAAEARHPIVAVTSIDDVRGDSSIAWLRAGLPRLIATDLGQLGVVDVVAPSRVRDVVVRESGSSTARLTEEQAIDVARRVGATWAVMGGISTAKGGYLLDVTMRKVSDAGETESFTILAPNPIELGRLAADRLASMLNVSPGGSAARYSGVVTSNPEAYRRFVRGMLAEDAEQFSTAATEFDVAIGLDSQFVEAIRARRTVAFMLGDATAEQRLRRLEQRYEARLPPIERLTDEVLNVDSLGETERADALSRQMVQRFPHDPRAHSVRADYLVHHGRWAEADTVLVRELSLDSLAMVAGDGPCTPCEVLWRLAQTRLAVGDRVGAEAAARRWVALQPDLPAAWRNLASTLAAVGRSAEAIEAGYHMMALSNEPPTSTQFGRIAISARRFDLVDSLLRSWRTSTDPVIVENRFDLEMMLDRERGQFVASAHNRLPATNGLALVQADGLARLGQLREARAILETSGHPKESPEGWQRTPTGARGFSWAHAIEADLLMRAGDTITARAMMDSIEISGKLSYYGRDARLSHHVQGMLYFAEGKFADAERELLAAEWSASGWTRTNLELARAQLALHHPADALETLRQARLAPVDAMARYAPRSELDWYSARAFAEAGQRDSALVYATYVRQAWKNADANVRSRLDSLPR